MPELDRASEALAARGLFNDALRSMERFVCNLDPARAQGLRDWLRNADAAGQPARIPAPPREGLPLVQQTDEHIRAVLAARMAWRKADRRLHTPAHAGGIGGGRP